MNSKYENRILQCKSLHEFVTMFFGLSKKEQISVFENDYTIAKGTELFRIRKDDGKTDFNVPEAWLPPPIHLTKQGWFNQKDQQILYVASDPLWLEREVALKKAMIIISQRISAKKALMLEHCLTTIKSLIFYIALQNP